LIVAPADVGPATLLAGDGGRQGKLKPAKRTADLGRSAVELAKISYDSVIYFLENETS
jgi:hypothetical protein